jgi:hypothetical protein
MLHCGNDVNVSAHQLTKAGDETNLPLCRLWNGSNKITL